MINQQQNISQISFAVDVTAIKRSFEQTISEILASKPK
jgi:hypothetical protein